MNKLILLLALSSFSSFASQNQEFFCFQITGRGSNLSLMAFAILEDRRLPSHIISFPTTQQTGSPELNGDSKKHLNACSASGGAFECHFPTGMFSGVLVAFNQDAFFDSYYSKKVFVTDSFSKNLKVLVGNKSHIFVCEWIDEIPEHRKFVNSNKKGTK